MESGIMPGLTYSIETSVLGKSEMLSSWETSLFSLFDSYVFPESLEQLLVLKHNFCRKLYFLITTIQKI